MSRIMGIDPSLTGCGLAMLDDGVFEVAVTVSTPADWTRGRRLYGIANSVVAFYNMHRPAFVAMEGYSFASKYNREMMGEVGGTIKLALFGLNVEPVLWQNQSWKVATLGKGGIKKEDLKLPLFQKYGVEIADMNQVEAFAVAMAEHRAQTGEAKRPVIKEKRGKK